jgi:hypothetical protein
MPSRARCSTLSSLSRDGWWLFDPNTLSSDTHCKRCRDDGCLRSVASRERQTVLHMAQPVAGLFRVSCNILHRFSISLLGPYLLGPYLHVDLCV